MSAHSSVQPVHVSLSFKELSSQTPHPSNWLLPKHTPAQSWSTLPPLQTPQSSSSAVPLQTPAQSVTEPSASEHVHPSFADQQLPSSAVASGS